jgi:hypothetical protein
MSDSPWPGAHSEQGNEPNGGHGQPGFYPPYPQPGYGQPGEPGYGQPSGPGYRPYPQPGYGQPGSYPPYGQPGGWSPEPKPGGIPLRPLGASEILNGAFASIRQNPAATLGLSVILLTIYGVFSTIASLILRGAVGSIQLPTAGQQLTPAQSRHLGVQLLTIGLPAALATTVLAFLVEVVLTGLLTVVIGRGVLGRKVSMGEAWRYGRRRLPAVLGAWLLTGLLFVGMWVVFVILIVILSVAHAGVAGVLLGVLGGLALVCVTIWLGVSLGLTAPVVVLEGVGPVGALRRSFRLVRRSFWRVFGIFLLTLAVVVIAGLVLQIPFTIAARFAGGGGQLYGLLGSTSTVGAVIIAAIGSIIADAVTRPISAGVTVLLYLDLRMRKEGLDLALQTAAGNEQLTGDEFATVWRPPAGGQGPWPPAGGQGPAAAPPA